MLKVVGASWEKTRLTSIMLGTVTVIAIFAIFFFEVPMDTNDGNYAATVFWSKQVGFSIKFWGQGNDPDTIKTGVARAYYRPDMKSTGWGSIEIQTQPHYPDWVQAHAAGLLEGSLCWQLIFWHWQNTVAYACESHQEFCAKARTFLMKNNDIRQTAINKSKTDPLWHQVNLFYAQLDGLEIGWRHGVTRSRKQKEIDIPHIDFLWMNAVSDLKDLESKYNLSQHFEYISSPLSVSLLKLLPSSDTEQKFLLAHASGGYYTEMLRMQKKYNFGFHMTNDNRSGLTPGQNIEFTSYPAAIHSQDDFYKVTGTTKLLVYGTSLRNYNNSLWNKTDSSKMLVGPRVMAANRISLNGSEWGEIMSSNNSGTGIKQWVVLKPIGKNLRTWLIEQIPGKTIVKEHTDTLYKDGYWATWGLPYNKELMEEIEYYKAADESDISSFFDKFKSILQNGHSNVTDLQSLIRLMRSPEMAIVGRSDIRETALHNIIRNNLNISNELQEKTHSSGEHSSAPVAMIKTTIPSDTVLWRGKRKELLDESDQRRNDSDAQTYFQKLKMVISGGHPLTAKDIHEDLLEMLTNGGILRKKLNGNIDLKIIAEVGNFQAAAGPPFTENNGAFNVEPFQWSKSLFKDVPHYGQSDKWNFDPIEPKWVWH